MGGGAIKNPKTGQSITQRLEKDKYEIIKQHVLHILKSNDIISEVVLELPGKQNFGDLDVLYVKNDKLNMREFIKKTFNCKQDNYIVSNGDVMSMAFDCNEIFNIQMYFQLDFIKVQSVEHLETARFYFSYGDIGSILGRIFNYYGIKYGDRGIWCEVLDSTTYPDKTMDVRNTIGKIFFTENINIICEKAGLDYDFWKNEIPHLTSKQDYIQIFKWIISCRLFDKDIFKILNSDHRARFELRPFYREFVEYIGITEINNANSQSSELGSCRYNKQMEYITFFNKTKDLEDLIEKRRLSEERKSKFTGGDLIELYIQIHNKTFAGKEIGNKISMVKKYCMSKTNINDWDDFIDNHTREQILVHMQEFVKSDN
jgi:hypothetical protein